MQHDVFADHLADMALFQKRIREGIQLRHQLVVLFGPEERLFEILIAVVGVILGVHAVADHEQLHILEQRRLRPIAVTLIAVDLVERLFQLDPAPFQLDLHEGQPVDQQGHVEPRLVVACHRHLRRDLILVLAPFLRVEELQVKRRAIVAGQLHPAPQGLSLLEHIALVEVVKHLGEFRVRQRHPVMPAQLRAQVGVHGGHIGQRDRRIAQACQTFDHTLFKLRFGLIIGHRLHPHWLHKHLLQQALLEGLHLRDLIAHRRDFRVHGREGLGDFGLFFGVGYCHL